MRKSGSVFALLPSRLPFYYGWLIVYALAITEPISWGILYYGFGVMLKPMQTELGWSAATLTGAFSLALLISGFAAVPVGRWLDRHGARALMTVGSCLAALLIIAWAQVQTVLGLYLVWACIGVITAMIFYEPAFAVVATWFVRKRSQAFTVLTFGGGLASVIFAPLATQWTQLFGWRMALWLLAALLALITIPLHAVILRRDPKSLWMLPDGERLDTIAAQSSDPQQLSVTPSLSVGEAMRGGNFWWLSTAFALSIFSAVAISVHLIPFLTSRGYPITFAAWTISVLGGSQIPGRLVFAPLSGRFSLRLITAMLFTLQLCGLITFFFAPNRWVVLLGAVLFGSGSGASTPARAALVAECYGVTNYGSINGMMAFVLTFAKAIGPIGMGLVYTWSGDYTLVFTLFILAAAGSVGAIWQVGQ